MAGEADEVVVGTQGQKPGDFSDGQGRKGAAPLPVIENGPKAKPNANGSGDEIVPKDDAAAQAAAAKAKEAEEAAGKTDEDEVPVVTEYTHWDNPSADAAVELLKEAGVTPAEASDIFDEAVKAGDPRLIDVKKLEAKVGKAKALLIMNGVQDYHRQTTETNTATVTAVKKVFGGDQGWDTVKTWAQTREKSDPAFKKELDGIREDLDKGGRAATAAAKDLLALYNGSPQTKGLGNANVVKGDGKAAPAGAPLSRSEYNEALKKAHADGAKPAAIAQLDARRRAGMAKGI